MEIAKRGFLSPATVLSLVLLVSLFAMVTIIAVGSFIMTVPLVFSPVMVSGVSRFFFRDVVYCFLVLHLISVPWF